MNLPHSIRCFHLRKKVSKPQEFLKEFPCLWKIVKEIEDYVLERRLR